MNRTALLIALVACWPFGFGFALLGLMTLVPGTIHGDEEFLRYWAMDGIVMTVFGFVFFYYVFRNNIGRHVRVQND